MKAELSGILHELLENICEINKLLETDLNHFVHNRKDDIQDSNQKKQSLIARIQQHFKQLEQLMHTASDNQQGQMSTLSELIAVLDSKEASMANKYRNEIKHALQSGSEQINCNSQVIVANLSYFHDIYRRLTQVAEKCVTTYEDPSKQSG